MWDCRALFRGNRNLFGLHGSDARNSLNMNDQLRG